MDDHPSPEADAGTERQGESADLPGMLRLSDDEGFVGDELTMKGFNLPPDRTIRVKWTSKRGMWGVRRSNRVLGPQYQPRTDTIFTTRTDDEREFKRTWTVKEDYGGEHTLELWAEDEVLLDSATYTVKPHFELDRTTAPMGGRFTLTGYGLGPGRFTSLYQVTWDNGFVGIMTAVQNRGTATAELRAAGPPGEHVIQVWRNFTGVPMLQNNTQAPGGEVAGGRANRWTVEVTEPTGAPPTAEMEAMYDEDPVPAHIPPVDEETDAELTIAPSSGKPGTEAIVTGREFPANAEVDLVWYTHGGERVADEPVMAEPRPGAFPTVGTDDEGAFQVDVTIPTDVGATRPILAEVDGRSVAATGFMLQPDIVEFTPTEGPVGTTISVGLTGLGWPLYENNYYVLYDNKPMGYVVSNLANDEGIVRFEVEAAGEPGYHFIDIVPSFNDVETDDFDFDQKPHLSYIDNHPVRAMPGMHLTFEVTDE